MIPSRTLRKAKDSNRLFPARWIDLRELPEDLTITQLPGIFRALGLRMEFQVVPKP